MDPLKGTAKCYPYKRNFTSIFCESVPKSPQRESLKSILCLFLCLKWFKTVGKSVFIGYNAPFVWIAETRGTHCASYILSQVKFGYRSGADPNPSLIGNSGKTSFVLGRVRLPITGILITGLSSDRVIRSATLSYRRSKSLIFFRHMLSAFSWPAFTGILNIRAPAGPELEPGKCRVLACPIYPTLPVG